MLIVSQKNAFENPSTPVFLTEGYDKVTVFEQEQLEIALRI